MPVRCSRGHALSDIIAAMTIALPAAPGAVPPPVVDESAAFEQALDRLLLESGAIDRRGLDRARRVAAEGGARLDGVLTQLGLITERGLAEALGKLLSLPLAGPP